MRQKYVIATITTAPLLAITLGVIPILLYRPNDAFAIIFFLYGIFCIASIRCLKGFWRPVAWNLAIILFCLAGVEAYFAGYTKKGNARTKYSPPPYYQSDPALGYRGTKGTYVNARKTLGDEEIYNVHYTLNEFSFRQSKPASGPVPPSVLFFGGSFTFGEGLEDDQTIAWQFQELKNHSLQSFNFGFHGYGPHQMLKILEDQREQDVVTGTKPILAIYLCLPDHLKRVAGQTSWDTFGPRYLLQPDGTAKYTGPFRNKFTAKILGALSRSHLYQKIHSRMPHRSDGQLDLLIGITNSSRKILNERYNIDLVVLLAGTPSKASFQELHQRFQENDYMVLDITTLVPGHPSEDGDFFIPKDGHPTAKYTQRIAEMLAEEFSFETLTDPK